MITTSLDGQWATVRRGREVVLLERGVAPAVAQLQLASEDVDLALVGPPTMLCVVSRAPEANVVLHAPPELEAVAKVELAQPMKLAAVTGTRLVLVSPDGKHVTVVRAAGRGLAAQVLEVGSPVEFAVGLERNQVLFGLHRKLEVWDAVSSRPLLRLQLQLPPPPRTVGAAQGHLWATRPGSDEVFIYRLSDGRPFRHHVGAPVEQVICHAASPLIVLVTPRGLVRLHCFAHSLTVIDSPWTPGMALAQLAAGEDISLLGLPPDAAEPWHVAIGGAGAPITSDQSPEDVEVSAAERMRAMRERASTAGAEYVTETPPPRPPPPPPPDPPAMVTAPVTVETAPPPAPMAPTHGTAWRDPLAVIGLELARGGTVELPVVPIDTELGELAHRLGLPTSARRALTVLYAMYLVGEPQLSIARLAHVLGDWSEPLGQGDLEALAMLRRRDGKVSLRASVTGLLDGASPRAIRVVGRGVTASRPGTSRVSRDGRSDTAIENDLAARLGRIAVIDGDAAPGLLEARLLGVTAVALAAPSARPQPWPREAGLVVVADGGAPAWVAALPALSA